MGTEVLAPELEGSTAESLSVLLVDDDEIVLEAFVDILEDQGYRMFTADSGQRAMEIFAAHRIDIVVTDIMLSGIDGIELLGLIHQQDSDIPVIMATAYASLASAVEAMKLGASNYLIKPISVGLLRAVLAEAATKRRVLLDNRSLVEQVRKKYCELELLGAERERVFEVIAQDLRQPLIDQTNWCQLLLMDSEVRLRSGQLETVTRVDNAANRMLAKVQDLLDQQKIAARARESGVVAERSISAADEGAAPLDVDCVSADRRRFKVLVVTGCSILRSVLVAVLRRRFHVYCAADGLEGLQLMVERPQLILSDLGLRRVDGVEMLGHVQRMARGTPVFAMYDHRDGEELVARARSLGIQELFFKPFPIGRLIEKIEAIAKGCGSVLSKSVVVVCADPHERQALHQLLDPHYKTHLAATAEQALGLAEGAVDLLIVDLAAEGAGQLARLMADFRRNHEDSRVLALAGKIDRGILLQLKEAGVNSAIRKPFLGEDILLRVRDLLGIEELEYDWGSILLKLS